MKHTPGTWYALKAGVEISPADDHEIYTMIGTLPVRVASTHAGHYSEAMPDGSPEPKYSVGLGEAYDNAAFIVRACNAHDELVAALELALRVIGSGGAHNGAQLEFMETALAKAKGKK